MAISEKIELLGKGIYSDIPDELTLTNIPTLSELEYVGAEDYDKTLLDSIFPSSILEKINFNNLLEIDFQWVSRCLRILNFGPYHTTNSVFCDNCGKTSYGEYRVNLNNVQCKPLPEGFVNELLIPKDSFLDFKGDVIIALPTIQQILNAYKDKAFQSSEGRINRELARICYMVRSVKGTAGMTPIEIKLIIEKEMSAADYIILKNEVADLTDYGLRAGGSAQCPKCGDRDAAFIALTDDRFFRPTLGDLRQWKDDRSSGED